MKQMTAVRMALCSLFTALIAIGAFLQIPLPNFDYFTLQFFFVLMAGMLLGARLGGSFRCLVCADRFAWYTDICGRGRNFLRSAPKLWVFAWLYRHSILQRLDYGAWAKKLEDMLSGCTGRIAGNLWNRTCL